MLCWGSCSMFYVMTPCWTDVNVLTIVTTIQPWHRHQFHIFMFIYSTLFTNKKKLSNMTRKKRHTYHINTTQHLYSLQHAITKYCFSPCLPWRPAAGAYLTAMVNASPCELWRAFIRCFNSKQVQLPLFANDLWRNKRVVFRTSYNHHHHFICSKNSFIRTRQLTAHEQDRQRWLSTYSCPCKKKKTTTVAVARPIYIRVYMQWYDIHRLE